jgi:hypothetical protein
MGSRLALTRKSLSSEKKKKNEGKEGGTYPPVNPLKELGLEKKKAKAEEDEAEEQEYVNPVTGERGGPRGPEPTRFGDWERKGRVSDF